MPRRIRVPGEFRMARKRTSEPQYAEHIRYGLGEIRAVRELDKGGFVADVRFADGSERTIQLAPEYWKTSVARFRPTPIKPKKKAA
jgi:hypothetical protein